ncbi:MAG: hypothetical protein M3O01_10635, partial [Pseudomonadota bacterium]|nr:hypothetical protein [Pseudomonadota bacterium]
APAGLGELRAALRACALDPLPLRVEMEGVVALSHAATALLMLARGWFGPCGGLTVTGVSPALRASLRRQLALDALLGEAR